MTRRARGFLRHSSAGLVILYSSSLFGRRKILSSSHYMFVLSPLVSPITALVLFTVVCIVGKGRRPAALFPISLSLFQSSRFNNVYKNIKLLTMNSFTPIEHGTWHKRPSHTTQSHSETENLSLVLIPLATKSSESLFPGKTSSPGQKKKRNDEQTHSSKGQERKKKIIVSFSIVLVWFVPFVLIYC